MWEGAGQEGPECSSPLPGPAGGPLRLHPHPPTRPLTPAPGAPCPPASALCSRQGRERSGERQAADHPSGGCGRACLARHEAREVRACGRKWRGGKGGAGGVQGQEEPEAVVRAPSGAGAGHSLYAVRFK